MTKREVEEYIMSQIFPNASHEVTAQNVRNAFAPIVERVWTFLEGEIGNLSQLQTTDKQSVVNAINAVLGKMKTDIDKVNADIANIGSKVGELDRKNSNITTENTESEEDAIVITTDAGVQVGKIDENGADFKNLKSNGKDVLAEVNKKQDTLIAGKNITIGADGKTISAEGGVGDLPITKESATSEEDSIEFANESGKPIMRVTPEQVMVEKITDMEGNPIGGGVGDLPISKEWCATSEEEQVWSDDSDTEDYAKIGAYGVKAKGFFDMEGNQIKGASEDILKGKKWVVIGDSFTNGATNNKFDSTTFSAGQRKIYPYYIANRTRINVVKFFEGGRTLAYPTSGTFANSLCNPSAAWYYQNIPADTDYITIYLGINDAHHAGKGDDGEDTSGYIPIGEAGDETTGTFFGAWNVVLGWLRQNRPFTHIGIIVTNGATDAYRQATIQMANKYGYPFIDLNGDNRTPAMIRSANANIPTAVKTTINMVQAADYAGGNLHPNDAAHELESYFIENFLRTI